MPSNNEIDILIAEIAKKYEVAIGKNDPILILYTLNKRLIDDSTQAQIKNLESFKAALNEGLVDWQNEAHKTAEKVLTASLKSSTELMNDSIEKITKQISEKTTSTIEKEYNPKIKALRQLLILNTILAFTFLLGIGIGIAIYL